MRTYDDRLHKRVDDSGNIYLDCLGNDKIHIVLEIATQPCEQRYKT